MKKDTLYEIYSILNNDTQHITDSLYKLMILGNDSEKIFLDFCKKGIVNEYTFDILLNISECLGEFENKYEQNDLKELIINMCSRDYILDNNDFDYILENLIFLLDFEYIKEFEMYENVEADYYRSQIIKEFIRIFDNMKNVDCNKIYSHSTEEIIDSYRMVVGDLKDTTTTDMSMTMNDMFLNRIHYYVDIISDKNIYELDDDKYVSVLNVVKSIQSLEELKSIKNKIKINRMHNTIDFIKIIDDYSSDLNELTIARITDEIGLKRKYDSKKQETIINRTVNNPSKELNIVKKVLKQDKNDLILNKK